MTTADGGAAIPPITDRAGLIRALGVACELEHGLALQYLFTAFSLKQSLDEGGLTQAELNIVLRWRGDLLRIAGQEMQHLVQANNLLLAVGGGAHLRRPNFPQPPAYYPTDLPWGLYRFNAATLRRYAAYERSGEESADSPCAGLWNVPEDAHLHGALGTRSASAVDWEITWKETHHHHERVATTIGELYAAIAQVFRMGLPGTLLIGDPALQVGPDESAFPQIRKIRTRDDALWAIQLLVEQGEGDPHVADDGVDAPTAECHPVHQDSHHDVFCRIWSQFDALRQREGFEPARPVAWNPLSRHHSDVWWPRYNLIEDDDTRAVNDLNSRVYAAMVLMLYRFFDEPAPSPNRQRQCAAFVQIMTRCLAPIGDLLCTLPMGAEGTWGPSTAGPSYETSRFVQGLPAGTAAVTVICEALEAAAREADALAALGTTYGSLAEVAACLRAIAAAYN